MNVPDELLRRYDRPGPRYTSYPTALEFHEERGADVYAAALGKAADDAAPLAMYLHLPFCAARCLFCGCNVVVTRKPEIGARYLQLLMREIWEVGRRLGGSRRLVQYHWGGGTPTWFLPEQLRQLHHEVADRFGFEPDAEVAVEVDPRVTSDEHLQLFRELGFNRLSVGVQDFDPAVQEAIDRIQPYEMTANIVEQARRLGFPSINLDLIYGLPHQNPESFRQTMARVVEVAPDRIALYSYAHVPWMRGHQRKLDTGALPDAATKLSLYRAALESLQAAGYVAIGMDHFARPDDELARAADHGSLGRNFMGYTVRAADDIVACGMSGIGELGGTFFQNHRKLFAYERAVEDGELPTERGYTLTDEDRLRRSVITSLMCRFEISFDEVSVDFAEHFRVELEALRPLEEDGLVRITAAAIEVTPLGRLFIRNICMEFDEHLRQAGKGRRFSRTV